MKFRQANQDRPIALTGKLTGCVLMLVALLMLGLSPAVAQSGTMQRMSDGSALVDLPMKNDVLLPADLVEKINQAVRLESDDALVSRLSGLMKSTDVGLIPAIAVAAANFAPDRGASIAGAAVDADTKQGIKAAQALRHVRGVGRRQIIVGVHDTGNRYAYDQVVSQFKSRRMPPPGSVMGDGVGRAGFNGERGGKGNGLLNGRRNGNGLLPW